MPAPTLDPFRYRVPLTMADLVKLDQQQMAIHQLSVLQGIITEEEAGSRYKRPKELRESKIKQDLRLPEVIASFYDTDTYSEFEDDAVLPSPPPSPKVKRDGLDLSQKAWNIECELIRVRGRYALEDFGFQNYEIWKQYQVKHSQNILKAQQRNFVEDILEKLADSHSHTSEPFALAQDQNR
ncbi:MAG: hypothetical protein LQ340_005138 [Diploschistes diacapsis]|nr:MAG: hypothetical protein LQ340_005138 [Diploschistes diacapsis]